jgi:hypothetical protein
MPIQGLTLPKNCPHCDRIVEEPKQHKVHDTLTELRCKHCDGVLGQLRGDEPLARK